MAGGADLAIDLEAALELRRVVHAERARRTTSCCRGGASGLLRTRPRTTSGIATKAAAQADNDGAMSMHGRLPQALAPGAAAPSAAGQPLRNTASEIELRQRLRRLEQAEHRQHDEQERTK